jgi:HlyD family secretion protein
VSVKRALITVFALLAFTGIVFASLGLNDDDQGAEVYVTKANRREIVRTVECSGQIQPRTKVNISAHVVAKIEKFHVKEGDDIEAGAPFVDLEREAYLAGRDTQAAQLEITRTDVRRAKVRIGEANAKLDRLRPLVAAGVASSEELEAAEREKASAKIELRRASQSVTQAKAGLNKAEDDLTKTTLYAPLAGRVIAINAAEGEVVVSGTMNNLGSVIGTIADVSEMVAEVNVDETEIIHVAPGQKAKITVDAIPDTEMEGQVLEVGSSGFRGQGQPDVTFFAVKILLEEPDPRLRPEMSARADIQVTRHEEAIVVPIEAVVRRARIDEEASSPTEGNDGEEDRAEEDDVDIEVVFVIEDGKARQRPIESDISDATHVEIREGLDAGTTVITGPYRTLKKLEEGDSVHAVDPKDKKRAEKKKNKKNKKNKKSDEDEDQGD